MVEVDFLILAETYAEKNLTVKPNFVLDQHIA